jgi:hypothetical protein
MTVLKRKYDIKEYEKNICMFRASENQGDTSKMIKEGLYSSLEYQIVLMNKIKDILKDESYPSLLYGILQEVLDTGSPAKYDDDALLNHIKTRIS